MKRMLVGFLTGMLLCAGGVYVFHQADRLDPVPVGAPTPAPEGEDWINLLDADHAAGWKNITDEKDLFAIEEGVLHVHGLSMGKLRYVGYAAERFGDFDLHLEFKLAPGANSGVFLRVQPEDKQYRGVEVQVLDDHGEAPSKNGTGALYDIATPMYNMALPAGEWNSYDITMNGGDIDVHVNGWRVLHTDLAKMTMPIGKFDFPFATYPPDGLIALQDHGGEVWFRTILIRPR